MNPLEVGSEAPLLDTVDEQDNPVMLPALERWTHLWFNPVFGHFGCKECQTSLVHDLYPDLRLAGCFPFGATYDSPEINARRTSAHAVWRVPVVQITKDTAAEWGALRETTDAWYEHTPAPVAYLIDPTGVVQHIYRKPDHRVHAKDVLRDVQAAVASTP